MGQTFGHVSKLSQTAYTYWPNIGMPLAILALLFSWQAILGQYWVLIGNYWHWRYIGKIYWINIGFPLATWHWCNLGDTYWVSIGFPLALLALALHWEEILAQYWFSIGNLELV